MKLIIPSFHEGKGNNSTRIINFQQTAIDQEIEKKKQCLKEVLQVSKKTNILSSPDSAFVCHQKIPMNGKEFPFEKIMAPQIVKEETLKYQQNIKLQDDYQGEYCYGIRKKYKVYSAKLKAEILDYAFQKGMQEACQKYKVSISKINIWLKFLNRSKNQRGRKTMDPQMQDRISEWLEEELGKGSKLTQKIIRQKAKQISSQQNFKASKGWLQKFFKRKPLLFKGYSQNRQCNVFKIEQNKIKEQQEIIIKQEQESSQS